MIEKDDFPGIVTNSDSGNPPMFSELSRVHERQLERAYQIGVLHGINAQSMAQVKNDVMSFDDYGWQIDD